MQTAFTDHAWDDYVYWQNNDIDTLQKINGIIREIKRDPFKGTGKPEALKGNLAGDWSRRIKPSIDWFIAFRVLSRARSLLL
jgi:toxin YoeB